MKKIYAYLLLLTVLISARSVESEIGINVGMTSTENSLGSNFDNKTVSATLQYNNYIVMPRFDLEYVDISNKQVKSLIKGSINGVYEFQNNTVVTPYVVGGVGYEDVRGAVDDVFDSHPFIHGGGGLIYEAPNEYQLKAKLEAKMLQILGGKNQENEASVTAGMSIPISAFQAKPIPKPVVPVPVVAYVEPVQVVAPVIDENQCAVKIGAPDQDRDGVEDNVDQCPDTPCDFTVDGYGCPIKTTLKINFKTNSAEIDSYSMSKVEDFAKILLTNKGSQVQILGHTDSRGSSQKNLLLSERRAESVVKALVDMGISSNRMHAQGKGESMPIAPNTTKHGQGLNRRIEAILSYPNER